MIEKIKRYVCRLFGHDWLEIEINDPSSPIVHYQKVCKRCSLVKQIDTLYRFV